MGRWGQWLLPQRHTTQLLTPPVSIQTSTPWPRQLTPQQGPAPQGWATGSPEGGASAFCQADAVRKEVRHPRKMLSVAWEQNSAQES